MSVLQLGLLLPWRIISGLEQTPNPMAMAKSEERRKARESKNCNHVLIKTRTHLHLTNEYKYNHNLSRRPFLSSLSEAKKHPLWNHPRAVDYISSGKKINKQSTHHFYPTCSAHHSSRVCSASLPVRYFPG